MINQFSPIPDGFFGTSGLTATSANHIANLLKLRYERAENELGSINFTTETMQIIGNETENVMKKAYYCSEEEMKVILEDISSCKGFIAFLREAIKAKDALMKEVEDYGTEDGTPPIPPTPERPISESDVFDAMSIGDRVTYLATEARAATYGKFIHPGGHLDNQRRRAFDAFSEPSKVMMAGRDTVIVKRENAIAVTQIDDIIMALQAEQRKSEAQLNGLKHGIEEKVKRDAQSKLDAYKDAKFAYDKAMDEYNRKRADIAAADQQARMDRRKVIEELKIIIPNQYRDLYSEVNG